MPQQGADCDARRDLTVVILGKTGSGKSSAANTILGERVFRAEMSFNPVTKHCEKNQRKVEGRIVTVIDTPCLSCHLNEELFTEIKKCVETGPHVFLLVIRVNEKLTDEMKNAIKWVEENMGKDVLCYIIVLFTYVDQLQETPLENYCRASQYIRTLINSCGGRFHPFISDGRQDNNQVKELLEKIDKLVWWNSDQTYTM
ncbi:GTPase IMAP family member 9-like [Sardina pilchardus]|uniref:GTPase IMAP family member 9-like n=1 Tax=Sardina pilchardus TaxID=27697 RepID=UPI002E0FC78B